MNIGFVLAYVWFGADPELNLEFGALNEFFVTEVLREMWL